MKNTKELVQEFSDYVNTFGDKSQEFCQAMSVEHRTLQQSFTKLCLKWLEQELLDGFKEKQIKEGYTGETLKLMSKPSGYLSCI
jgi:hypothetical protein